MQTMHRVYHAVLHKRNLKGANTSGGKKADSKENERVFKPNELFSFDECAYAHFFIDEEHTVKTPSPN